LHFTEVYFPILKFLGLHLSVADIGRQS